ncbi:MAG: hypothetical protein WBF97_00330 [Comamonas sp.]
MEQNKQEQFAIVELFGHARIAGRISEQVFGGTALVRVDVPEVSFVERPFGQPERIVTVPAHTRSFGGSAIYSINWVDEAAAKLAAQSIKHRPIQAYGLVTTLREMTDKDRQQLLAGPVVSIEGRNDDGLPW